MGAVSDTRRTAGFIVAASLVHAALLAGGMHALTHTFAPLPRRPTLLQLQPYTQARRHPESPVPAPAAAPRVTGESRRPPLRRPSAPVARLSKSPSAASVATPTAVRGAAADSSADPGGSVIPVGAGEAPRAAAGQTAALSDAGAAPAMDPTCPSAVHHALQDSLRQASRAVRGMGRTGRVTLVFALDTAGRVTDTQMAEQQGAALLVEAARALLLRATLPAACAGQYRWPLRFSPQNVTQEP